MSVSAGYRPPPPYASAPALLRRAAAGLRPDRRQPSQAATDFRWLNIGGRRMQWSHETAPYMVEPLDQTVSRRFRSVVFCGPARSVKTDGLILNTILHRVTCWPRDMMVLTLSQIAAREFSIRKLSDLIRESPDVAARQLAGRGANNLYDKLFSGGMRLSLGWPVGSHLTGRDYPDVLITELDKLPDDIEGLGDPFALARKRTQTYGSLGMTIAECSPSRDIVDEAWKPDPDRPHLAPPTTGILALYNQGTRGRWYWTCPGCADPFEPLFERLTYPDDGEPVARGRQAAMVCPHCGYPVEPQEKSGLNLSGRWLHEAADGSLVGIDDPALRDTDIASYWLAGPAACFQHWWEMVGNYEAARETFSATGSDTLLRQTVNEDQSRPYVARASSALVELSPESLRGRAVALPVGVVPSGAAFLTAAVDVQDARFVVQVDAWGVGLERWTIDRFDLGAPPPGAPGGDRTIQPPIYREDWAALDPLFERDYPVAGGGWALRIAAVIVDSGGSPGVTPNAIAWWRRLRDAGQAGRVHLLKGVPGWKRERVVVRDIVRPGAKSAGRPGKQRPLYRLTLAGTDVLKNEVAAALVRPEPGPGAHHLCAALPDQVVVEMAAERPTPDGWRLKPGQRRNEALDLAVYGRALVIGPLGGEAIRWAAPPAWAHPDRPLNAFSRPLERTVERVDPDADASAAARASAPLPETRPDPPASPGRRIRRIRSHGIGG